MGWGAWVNGPDWIRTNDLVLIRDWRLTELSYEPGTSGMDGDAFRVRDGRL